VPPPPDYLALLSRAEAAVSGSPPATARQFLATVDAIHHTLGRAVEVRRAAGSIVGLSHCSLHAVAAVVGMVRWIARHLDSGDPSARTRSLVYLTKFGATIDSLVARAHFLTWSNALVQAGVYAQPDEEFACGLALGILPVDHESPVGEVRIDAGFKNDLALTVDDLARAGLGCRTISVVCSAQPHPWQRIATIAALSSFTSRSYLFIDVTGSGSLTARIGGLAMEDFPHVTVARLEDLPPVARPTPVM
jgi:hypothetical protein